MNDVPGRTCRRGRRGEPGNPGARGRDAAGERGTSGRNGDAGAAGIAVQGPAGATGASADSTRAFIMATLTATPATITNTVADVPLDTVPGTPVLAQNITLHTPTVPVPFTYLSFARAGTYVYGFVAEVTNPAAAPLATSVESYPRNPVGPVYYAPATAVIPSLTLGLAQFATPATHVQLCDSGTFVIANAATDFFNVALRALPAGSSVDVTVARLCVIMLNAA